jgi:hypothetical protein
MDGRIARALGLAHAQLGNTQAALSLFERVIASGGSWVADALLCVGDVHFTGKRYALAEESYFASLEHLVPIDMADIEIADVEDSVSARGSLRTRQAAAWHMRPFDLVPATSEGGGPDDAAVGDAGEPEDEPASISLVFLEGDEGGAGDDAVDLVELEDGRFGALIQPEVGLATLWARLADVYVSTGRLDEAHTAANASGTIAEVLGDNDGMSRAFDILAGIGMQRRDPEFLRWAASAATARVVRDRRHSPRWRHRRVRRG